MKIESIIFDFDGTLAELCIDFAEMKLRLSALARMFSPSALPPPFLPVLEWLAWLEKSLESSNGDRARSFRDQATELIREIELEAARQGALFAFTRPMLAALRQKSIKTAIITRNCDAAVRLVFPDISDYCGAFLARDHVVSPKPDPAHLLGALEAIGADPGTALMIGDHPIDIQTGKAAGILTAGVCSGNASRDDLIRSGADWVACNCEELMALLTGEGVIA